MRIDLNADLGESFGAWPMGQDALLMPVISSANVACGGHAGDPGTMRRTVRLARSHGVAVGAHPGYPDLLGFGRREMQMSPQDVEDLVVYQVSALAGIARSEGVRLQHVKAHGALYNQACRDEDAGRGHRPGGGGLRSVAGAVRPARLSPAPGRPRRRPAGGRRGVRRPRLPRRRHRWSRAAQPGSVIHDLDTVVARAVAMVCEGSVDAIDGSRIAFEADTLCVHGDTPGAAALAAAIRRGLEDAGVTWPA